MSTPPNTPHPRSTPKPTSSPNHSPIKCLPPLAHLDSLPQTGTDLTLTPNDPDPSSCLSHPRPQAHLCPMLTLAHSHPWPARAAPMVNAQAPKQLSPASVDGAPVWSSGDQKTAPPTPPEMTFPKDHIFQLDSSQVIKVKALRVAGRFGWVGVAMLCSDPHCRPL